MAREPALTEERGGERIPSSVWTLSIAGAALLFTVAVRRHAVHRSTAFDLGFYDQIAYLLSRGEAPVSSFLGFHFLGDHVSLVMYPLSLLYRIHPTPHWLFAVQALALAVGVGLTWKLARAYAVEVPMSKALAAAYLMYPAVYAVNLFDFHPDVLAVPALLLALLAAKERRPVLFAASVLWVLACKAPFSLTVGALGLWLLTWGGRRALGALAVVLGATWFYATTQVIIPRFSGGEAIGVARFSYLGDSVGEVLANVVRRPEVVADQLLTTGTLTYLVLVGIVFLWWIAPRRLWALLPAVPTLLLNLLGNDPKQRTLTYQYALPVLPFLLLAVASSLGAGDRTLVDRLPRAARRRVSLPVAAVVWAAVMLVWLGGWPRGAELSRPATWAETEEAFTRLPPHASLLTDNRLAPQLTHRATVRLLPTEDVAVPDDVDFVLLDLAEPWPDTRASATELAAELARSGAFQQVWSGGGVVLYERRTS